MTDWQMVVESYPERPPQLPEVHAQDAEQGPEPFHDHAAERGGAARPVHLRGSRDAVEHRRAQPERQIYRPPVARSITARASFANGTVKIQSTSRSAPTCGRGSRSTTASCTSSHIDLPSDGARRCVTGDVDLAHWPEQTYQVRSKIDFATQKSIFFHSESVHRLRRGRLQRHVPPVQGRTRAEGHVHQPARRRERLALPEPARVGAVGAGPARGHQRHRRRSTAAPRASTTGWRRSAEPGVPTARDVGRRLSRRRPGAAHRLPRDQGAAARRHAPRDATGSNGRSASGRRRPAAARSPSQPPAGVRTDDARARSPT